MKESKNRKKSFKVNKKVCAIIGVAVVVILLVVGICLFVKGRELLLLLLKVWQKNTLKNM